MLWNGTGGHRRLIVSVILAAGAWIGAGQAAFGEDLFHDHSNSYLGWDDVPPEVMRALRGDVRLHFRQKPFREAIRRLRDVTPVEVVLHEQDIPRPEPLITIDHEGWLSGALDDICAPAWLAWDVVGDAIHVGLPERVM